jgi:hypothetical protein
MYALRTSLALLDNHLSMAVHADIILTRTASRDDKSGYLRVNHREINYLQKHAAECAAALVSWPYRAYRLVTGTTGELANDNHSGI